MSDHVGIHTAVPDRPVRRSPRIVRPRSLCRQPPFFERHLHGARNDDGRFGAFSRKVFEKVIGHHRDLIRFHICSGRDHALKCQSPLLAVVPGPYGHLEVVTFRTRTLQNVFTRSIGQGELIAPALALTLALSQSR